jgi:hypothetical protein
LSFAKPILLPKPNLNHHTKIIYWFKNSAISSINWNQESEAEEVNSITTSSHIKKIKPQTLEFLLNLRTKNHRTSSLLNHTILNHKHTLKHPKKKREERERKTERVREKRDFVVHHLFSSIRSIGKTFGIF